MRSFSFLAAFAIIFASAFAASRPSLHFGSIPKELLGNVADADFDRIMDQTVITWAQVQLEVLNHSQQTEALLTGAGHSWIWGRCQNVIRKASDEANAMFVDAIKAADPNKDTYELILLLVNGGKAATDVFVEAMTTVDDLIQSEAKDVYPEANLILIHARDNIYEAFVPLIEIIWPIIWPGY